MFFRSAIRNSTALFSQCAKRNYAGFQIYQCAVRNSAIADTSATHNHSQEKLKLQNKKNKIQGGHFEVRDGIAQEVPRIL